MTWRGSLAFKLKALFTPERLQNWRLAAVRVAAMVSEREMTRSFGNAKRKQRQDSDAVANCPICCQDLRQCVALIPCGHAFCKPCVQAWLKQSPSCPTCRSSVEDGQPAAQDKTNLWSLRNLLLPAKAAGALPVKAVPCFRSIQRYTEDLQEESCK
eukprot:Skav216556  [mRNA]  locus=scaffold1776:397338:398743:- [translate_table: standard]